MRRLTHLYGADVRYGANVWPLQVHLKSQLHVRLRHQLGYRHLRFCGQFQMLPWWWARKKICP